MKKQNIPSITGLILFIIGISLTGCYKMQKDYDYVKYELDPHVNMTAKAFIQRYTRKGGYCFSLDEKSH